MDCDVTKLNLLSKDEWRDVTRSVRPSWTDEQFEECWAEFCEMKRWKELS